MEGGKGRLLVVFTPWRWLAKINKAKIASPKFGFKREKEIESLLMPQSV